MPAKNEPKAAIASAGPARLFNIACKGRIAAGYDADFTVVDLKRSEIARYGLALDEVQMAIETMIGGESITTTVEGRERYPVSVRYARELREKKFLKIVSLAPEVL